MARPTDFLCNSTSPVFMSHATCCNTLLLEEFAWLCSGAPSAIQRQSAGTEEAASDGATMWSGHSLASQCDLFVMMMVVFSIFLDFGIFEIFDQMWSFS